MLIDFTAGDTISGVPLSDLASLLQLGVRVAFINGDADYICNWLGGEAVSLALAALLPAYPANAPSSTSTLTAGTATATSTSYPSSYASAFSAAGYADIVVNSTYVGGAVRQYGNLSFSRIYDSGHFVPFYQPETAFTVFTRIMLGTDLSTGEPINLSNFSSTGPQNATHTNSIPAQPSPTCWIRDMSDTCSTSEISSILSGQGVVEQGVWYANANAASSALPSTSVTAGVPGSPIKSSSTVMSAKTVIPPTGVYTATATPTSTAGAAGPMTVGAVPTLGAMLMALGMGMLV